MSIAYFGLEGGVEVREEGVVPSQGEDSLLHHGALYVVIHHDHVLLQGLHRKVLPLTLQLSQQHLGTRHTKGHHVIRPNRAT